MARLKGPLFRATTQEPALRACEATCTCINAPEGCQRGTHTNETAYPLGTYASVHTQTHSSCTCNMCMCMYGMYACMYGCCWETSQKYCCLLCFTLISRFYNYLLYGFIRKRPRNSDQRESRVPETSETELVLGLHSLFEGAHLAYSLHTLHVQTKALKNAGRGCGGSLGAPRVRLNLSQRAPFARAARRARGSAPWSPTRAT